MRNLIITIIFLISCSNVYAEMVFGEKTKNHTFPHQYGDDSMRTQCCVCKLFLVDDSWIEQEYDLSFIPEKMEDRISHGYCPDCSKKEMDLFNNRKEGQIFQ